MAKDKPMRATPGLYRDYEPSDPLSQAHERYAVLRAQGVPLATAAKEVGVKPETARRGWERPFTREDGSASTVTGSTFHEDGVGGAIQRRVSYLREAAAGEAAYTPAMMLQAEMDLIRRAAQKGDFATALKYVDKLRCELKDKHGTEPVVEVSGEDVTDLLRGGGE